MNRDLTRIFQHQNGNKLRAEEKVATDLNGPFKKAKMKKEKKNKHSKSRLFKKIILVTGLKMVLIFFSSFRV